MSVFQDDFVKWTSFGFREFFDAILENENSELLKKEVDDLLEQLSEDEKCYGALFLRLWQQCGSDRDRFEFRRKVMDSMAVLLQISPQAWRLFERGLGICRVMCDDYPSMDLGSNLWIQWFAEVAVPRGGFCSPPMRIRADFARLHLLESVPELFDTSYGVGQMWRRLRDMLLDCGIDRKQIEDESDFIIECLHIEFYRGMLGYGGGNTGVSSGSKSAEDLVSELSKCDTLAEVRRFFSDSVGIKQGDFTELDQISAFSSGRSCLEWLSSFDINRRRESTELQEFEDHLSEGLKNSLSAFCSQIFADPLLSSISDRNRSAIPGPGEEESESESGSGYSSEYSGSESTGSGSSSSEEDEQSRKAMRRRLKPAVLANEDAKGSCLPSDFLVSILLSYSTKLWMEEMCLGLQNEWADQLRSYLVQTVFLKRHCVGPSDPTFIRQFNEVDFAAWMTHSVARINDGLPMVDQSDLENVSVIQDQRWHLNAKLMVSQLDVTGCMCPDLMIKLVMEKEFDQAQKIIGHCLTMVWGNTFVITQSMDDHKHHLRLSEVAEQCVNVLAVKLLDIQHYNKAQLLTWILMAPEIIVPLNPKRMLYNTLKKQLKNEDDVMKDGNSKNQAGMLIYKSIESYDKQPEPDLQFIADKLFGDPDLSYLYTFLVDYFYSERIRSEELTIENHCAFFMRAAFNELRCLKEDNRVPFDIAVWWRRCLLEEYQKQTEKEKSNTSMDELMDKVEEKYASIDRRSVAPKRNIIELLAPLKNKRFVRLVDICELDERELLHFGQSDPFFTDLFELTNERICKAIWIDCQFTNKWPKLKSYEACRLALLKWIDECADINGASLSLCRDLNEVQSLISDAVRQADITQISSEVSQIWDCVDESAQLLYEVVLNGGLYYINEVDRDHWLIVSKWRESNAVEVLNKSINLRQSMDRSRDQSFFDQVYFFNKSIDPKDSLTLQRIKDDYNIIVEVDNQATQHLARKRAEFARLHDSCKTIGKVRMIEEGTLEKQISVAVQQSSGTQELAAIPKLTLSAEEMDGAGGAALSITQMMDADAEQKKKMQEQSIKAFTEKHSQARLDFQNRLKMLDKINENEIFFGGDLELEEEVRSLLPIYDSDKDEEAREDAEDAALAVGLITGSDGKTRQTKPLSREEERLLRRQRFRTRFVDICGTVASFDAHYDLIAAQYVLPQIKADMSDEEIRELMESEMAKDKKQLSGASPQEKAETLRKMIKASVMGNSPLMVYYLSQSQDVMEYAHEGISFMAETTTRIREANDLLTALNKQHRSLLRGSDRSKRETDLKQCQRDLDEENHRHTALLHQIATCKKELLAMEPLISEQQEKLEKLEKRRKNLDSLIQSSMIEMDLTLMQTQKGLQVQRKKRVESEQRLRKVQLLRDKLEMKLDEDAVALKREEMKASDWNGRERKLFRRLQLLDALSARSAETYYREMMNLLSQQREFKRQITRCDNLIKNWISQISAQNRWVEQLQSQVEQWRREPTQTRISSIGQSLDRQIESLRREYDELCAVAPALESAVRNHMDLVDQARVGRIQKTATEAGNSEVMTEARSVERLTNMSQLLDQQLEDYWLEITTLTRGKAFDLSAFRDGRGYDSKALRKFTQILCWKQGSQWCSEIKSLVEKTRVSGNEMCSFLRLMDLYGKWTFDEAKWETVLGPRGQSVLPALSAPV